MQVEGAHARPPDARPIAQQGRGGGCRHPPARVRRAGRRIAAHAQQESGHARRLGRQRQPPAGRQVEQGRTPPQLHRQSAQRRTTQRVHRRAQQHGVIRHDADHQPFGIDAQRRQTGTIGQAARPPRRRRPQPQQGRFPRRQPRQDQPQSRAGPFLFRRAEKFMNPPPRQTAVQSRVQRGMTRPHPRMGPGGWNSLQRCDMPFQGDKGPYRLGHAICSWFVLFLLPRAAVNQAQAAPSRFFQIADRRVQPHDIAPLLKEGYEGQEAPRR